MKIVAWFFLVLFLGAPVVIALWWVFPLVAGVCLWLLWKYRNSEYVGKFLRPILLVLLLAFVLWLWFVPRRHLLAKSYESNSSASLIRRLAPESSPPSEEVQRTAREQRRFLDALGRERLKVAEISSALELYNSADEVFVIRNKNGISDDAGLGSALSSLRSQLAPHKLDDGSSTPDLLDPAALKNLVQQAGSVLDKTQTDALRPDMTADQVSEQRNQLPRLVSRFQVDSLYAQVANLENALRHALQVNLAPQPAYSFAYDRSSDTLASEQKTLVNLAGQQAVSINVESLLARSTDPNVQEVVAVREDDSPERELKPTERQIPLHPETKVLTVTHRMLQSHASYQLVTDRLWIPFRGLALRWLIPLNSSFVVDLRFPEDPSIIWPLTLPIRTGSGDTLQAVYLPLHSYFHDDAGLTTAVSAETGAPQEVLVGGPATPKIGELATDKTIRVELLPAYLSNSLGQRYKDYLAVENLWVSLGVAIVSAFSVGGIFRSDSSEKSRAHSASH